MPNDAKLGLVVGVGLVIAIAVVFFRKDPEAAQPQGGEGSTAAVSAPHPPSAAPRGLNRPAKAKPAIRNDETGKKTQRHTVQEGETLFSLAQHYYGDKEKFVALYRVNREAVKTPDQLTPGTVLVIPDLPEGTDAEASADR